MTGIIMILLFEFLWDTNMAGIIMTALMVLYIYLHANWYWLKEIVFTTNLITNN